MLKSLRMRIALILSLLIVAVMVGVGTFMLSNVSNFYHEDFTRQMQEVFSDEELMATLRSDARQDSSYARVYEVLRAYAGKLGIDSYRDFYVLDASDASYLTGSNSVAGATLERTPNIIRAMTGAVGDGVEKSASYLDYAVPISGEDGTVRYIVYVKDTKQELNEMVWMLFAIVLQALFFGMIIAVGLSILLSKAITNPVESITKGAQAMARGELDLQLPVLSRDEIGVLTQTFNDMAMTLKGSMAQVEQERNKLQTIFLYLSDGVAAFDHSGALLHLNHAAQEMLGLASGQQPDFDGLFGPFGFSFADCSASESGVEREVTVGAKALQMHIAPFESQQNEPGDQLLGGLIVVIHDITEQQKLELSRREFVANVSHELRTPLTSIKSYTETILESDELPKPLLHRFLGVIINEADRMTRIVKDLLALSRLDSQKMDWRFSQFSVNQLLNNIYDSMLLDARNHEQELTLSAQETLGLFYGDKERVEQVIVNIVSNAIKYTQNGGQIAIHASRAADELVIAVQDNGIGIPKEDIPRLFERFYRVDKARSRERGGTGLGLAIAKEIVTVHEGRIEVESEVGVGTTMTVFLPYREPPAQQEGQESES